MTKGGFSQELHRQILIKILVDVFKKFNGRLKEYLMFLIPFIKKSFTKKNILQGLGEVLEKQQKEWVKKELITKTVEEIERKLNWFDSHSQV